MSRLSRRLADALSAFLTEPPAVRPQEFYGKLYEGVAEESLLDFAFRQFDVWGKSGHRLILSVRRKLYQALKYPQGADRDACAVLSSHRPADGGGRGPADGGAGIVMRHVGIRAGGDPDKEAAE